MFSKWCCGGLPPKDPGAGEVNSRREKCQVEGDTQTELLKTTTNMSSVAKSVTPASPVFPDASQVSSATMAPDASVETGYRHGGMNVPQKQIREPVWKGTAAVGTALHVIWKISDHWRPYSKQSQRRVEWSFFTMVVANHYGRRQSSRPSSSPHFHSNCSSCDLTIL
jgi:hypothetical protein